MIKWFSCLLIHWFNCSVVHWFIGSMVQWRIESFIYPLNLSGRWARSGGISSYLCISST